MQLKKKTSIYGAVTCDRWMTNALPAVTTPLKLDPMAYLYRQFLAIFMIFPPCFNANLLKCYSLFDTIASILILSFRSCMHISNLPVLCTDRFEFLISPYPRIFLPLLNAKIYFRIYHYVLTFVYTIILIMGWEHILQEQVKKKRKPS